LNAMCAPDVVLGAELGAEDDEGGEELECDEVIMVEDDNEDETEGERGAAEEKTS